MSVDFTLKWWTHEFINSIFIKYHKINIFVFYHLSFAFSEYILEQLTVSTKNRNISHKGHLSKTHYMNYLNN